jgi:hypothetical protein
MNKMIPGGDARSGSVVGVPVTVGCGRVAGIEVKVGGDSEGNFVLLIVVDNTDILVGIGDSILFSTA